MTVAYFQIPLSVKPKNGGEAVLEPPKALDGLNFGFVAVREGGKEGIIRVEEAEAVLKNIEEQKDCMRLTAQQAEAARKNYSKPKQKSKFRMKSQVLKQGEAAEQYELDEKGSKIIDTIQTVRSGFYLIDVPIIAA